MTMKEALENVGFEATKVYGTPEDVTNILRTHRTGDSLVELANNLYIKSENISDNDMAVIKDICPIGFAGVKEKIRKNRYMIREISYKDLDKYEYVIYASKKYGVVAVVRNAENIEMVNRQIEDMLLAGEPTEYPDVWEQDYVALFIDTRTYVDVSYRKQGTYVTRPCLGRNIREKMEQGIIDLTAFTEKGGIIDDNHFYLLHRNKDKEYYVVRYREFDYKN